LRRLKLPAESRQSGGWNQTGVWDRQPGRPRKRGDLRRQHRRERHLLQEGAGAVSDGARDPRQGERAATGVI